MSLTRETLGCILLWRYLCFYRLAMQAPPNKQFHFYHWILAPGFINQNQRKAASTRKSFFPRVIHCENAGNLVKHFNAHLAEYFSYWSSLAWLSCSRAARQAVRPTAATHAGTGCMFGAAVLARACALRTLDSQERCFWNGNCARSKHTSEP